MTFKEQLAFDVDHVFLNRDEFAEEADITLNGLSCKAIITGPQSVMPQESDTREGVSFETVNLRIAAGVIPLPRARRGITYNGQKWMVSEATDEAGIYSIDIYREKS